MGAPSPELVDLWLARAFNAHDVEAAAAMYHPDASVVRLDQVHSTDAVARGAAGIRETMAGLHWPQAAHGRGRTPYDGVRRLRAVPVAVADHRHRPERQAHRGSPPRHGGHAAPAEWRVGLLHRPSMGGGPVLGGSSAAPHRVTRAAIAPRTAWTRSWSPAAGASPVATSRLD